MKRYLFTILFSCAKIFAQDSNGKLFVIGGGNRSEKLINQMLTTAQLRLKDYIVVLPMASAEPDSAYVHLKNQVQKLTNVPIVMLNFTKNTAYDNKLIDSLSKAKLIYIAGGDQNRFMNIVVGTPVFDAIHKAYKAGSTIAGTSAGAAVMSEKMITGNQKLSAEYQETFDNIKHNNIEIAQGLGLIKTAIIDQHFLKRSRYNRLISALIEFPLLAGIGIDESTAIIINGNTATVVGESEVIVMLNPVRVVKNKNNLVSVSNLNLSIFVEGQSFQIK